MSDMSALNYVMMELYRIHTIPQNPSNKSTMSYMCLTSDRSALNFVMMELYRIHTIPLNSSNKSTMSDVFVFRQISFELCHVGALPNPHNHLIHVIDVLKNETRVLLLQIFILPVCIARVKYYKVKLILIRTYHRKQCALYKNLEVIQRYASNNRQKFN